MTDRTNRLGVIFSGAMLSLLAIGCNNDKTKLAADIEFRPDAEPRQLDLIMREQAASGARADATLHGQHFDGAKLNSLGTQKLALMMADDDTAPMVVYLAIATNYQHTSASTQAVQTYLRDHGMTANTFQVQVGANPYNYHAAQPNITRLPKTENPPIAGGATSESTEDATMPIGAPAGNR